MFKRLVAASIMALASAVGTVAAQDKWPSKPVTVIVPFGAGGNTDVLARVYAERLSARTGQQFIIENKAGAGGTTGIAQMVRSTADGYTIAVGTGSGLATNPVIMKDKLTYDAGRDIAYLHLMATQPNLLVVNPTVPAKTLQEFVDWLKANPEQAYATSGNGSSQHLCGEMLMQMAGVKMNAVAYRASNQTMQDLIGGQIKITCDNFSTAWEQAKSGNVRALAVSSTKRYPFSPDVPTFAETFPGFEVLAWFGWIAPAGTPKPIVDRLIAELDAIGKEPETRKRLETLTVEASGLSGSEFAAFAERERKNLVPIVEKAGIKPQ